MQRRYPNECVSQCTWICWFCVDNSLNWYVRYLIQLNEENCIRSWKTLFESIYLRSCAARRIFYLIMRLIHAYCASLAITSDSNIKNLFHFFFKFLILNIFWNSFLNHCTCFLILTAMRISSTYKNKILSRFLFRSMHKSVEICSNSNLRSSWTQRSYQSLKTCFKL